MASIQSLPDLLAKIQQETKEPFPWHRVRPLLALFWIRLLGTVFYLFAIFDLLPFSYTGAERILNSGVCLCLFLLTRAHRSYLGSALTVAASLATGLIPSLFGSTMLIMVISSLCALLSNYLEYMAHSQLTMRQDKCLTRRWNNLFFWNVMAAILGGIAFILVQVLFYALDSSNLLLYLLMLCITYVPDLIVDILFLIYMGRTVRLIKSQKILF